MPTIFVRLIYLSDTHGVSTVQWLQDSTCTYDSQFQVPALIILLLFYKCRKGIIQNIQQWNCQQRPPKICQQYMPIYLGQHRKQCLLSVFARAIQPQPNPVHKIATHYKIYHLMKFNRNIINNETCPLEMKGISFNQRKL